MSDRFQFGLKHLLVAAAAVAAACAFFRIFALGDFVALSSFGGIVFLAGRLLFPHSSFASTMVGTAVTVVLAVAFLLALAFVMRLPWD